ncbi:hypothetical protein ACCD11_09120, partial [Variovorax sp. Varisp36]
LGLSRGSDLDGNHTAKWVTSGWKSTHMYQHVLIANIGEFGGSTAQAPFDSEHRRLIAHSHGSDQIAFSVFDVRIDDFGPKLEAANEGIPVLKTVVQRIGKTPPAGLKR